jgi:xanthine dehydrogenase YagS FAD-binding subunit
MRPFAYERAADLASALRVASKSAKETSRSSVQFLAGGTTLLDLMKLEVAQPATIVDINPLESTPLGRIEMHQHGLRLGALVRMAEAAEHREIREQYPVIAQSLKLAASQQLRNMASLGGNVLQRTRCTYFRDVTYEACNKRDPGSGCAALSGVNRTHAILGTSNDCIATYPGDFAQALLALDASVEIARGGSRRTIPFAALHRKPGSTPNQETNLHADDLIVSFIVPSAPWTRRSLYLKIRDRQSYEFALASAAVALDQSNGIVRQARIALGGVATVPWRSPAAESVLLGKPIDEQTVTVAADAAFADAKGYGGNEFKISLGKRTLCRALLQAATLEI